MCSLKKKDLDRHYKEMVRRYHIFRGMDDPNMKQVFLASIPESLSHEATKLMQSHSKQLGSTSFGEIYQFVILALKKLCSQKRFFDDYLKRSKQLTKVCQRPDLQIKCKSNRSCSCPTKKKFYSRRIKFSPPNAPAMHKFRCFKHCKFLRKKKRRGKWSNRCYLCNRPSHFAKNCPNKPKQSAKMMQQLS